MAKLPNGEKAIIEAERLYGYILSTAHPVGRFKVGFFSRFGYSADNWPTFERQLRGLVASRDVTKAEKTPYGQKFVVEGSLLSPSGETMQIVTVWFILKGDNIPRFVTAYPGELQ